MNSERDLGFRLTAIHLNVQIRDLVCNRELAHQFELPVQSARILLLKRHSGRLTPAILHHAITGKINQYLVRRNVIAIGDKVPFDRQVPN